MVTQLHFLGNDNDFISYFYRYFISNHVKVLVLTRPYVCVCVCVCVSAKSICTKKKFLKKLFLKNKYYPARNESSN